MVAQVFNRCGHRLEAGAICLTNDLGIGFGLEVFRLQAGYFGKASEHVRANFLTVMEGKDHIRPTGARQSAVRTGGFRGPLNLPANPLQSRQYTFGFAGGPATHAAANRIFNGSASISP